jgi:hypothetical protein
VGIGTYRFSGSASRRNDDGGETAFSRQFLEGG